MKNSFLVFFLFLFGLSANAQDSGISPENMAKLKTYEDTLAFTSFLVINDSLPENRFASTKKVITTLVEALQIENSFHYPFDRMKSVSIQYPADSTFRIFTWQLYVDVDEYRYYGAIQMNNSELKLFPLIDRSSDVYSHEQEVLSPKRWYGALYYKVHQFDTAEGERQYLLFGFDAYSMWNKRKLVDVLTFKEGEPVFGAPAFVHQDKTTGEITTKNRLLYEYSAEASFKLNYDETYEIILFDHLIMTGSSYGQGPAFVPDGSYEGYKLEDGKWNWVEKVFSEVLDEAPRPEPVLDNRKKGDIMGKGN